MKPNKEIEVNQFLTYVKLNLERSLNNLKGKYKDNYNLINDVFYNNYIYKLLIYYGTNGQHTVDSKLFSRWIKRYKLDPRIDVFVNPSWRYFCQFISKKELDEKNHIKLYIPLDASHLEEGATLIFDFLSNNDIKHLSKIGSNIRIDDIVVRVENKEDAEKLINFVKNNEYIQEGLLVSNPFLINEGGVSLTSDGTLSFNYTLATAINHYMKTKIDLNSLTIKDINAEDFYNYVGNIYNDIFIEKNVAAHSLFDINRSAPYKYRNINLSSLKGVLNIILKSNTTSFTKDNFYDLFEQMKNSDQYLYEYNRKNDESEELDTPRTIVEACLFSIRVMSNKYGEENALKQFLKYVNTEDPKYLTRDKGVRDICKSFNIASNLENYTLYNNISINEYLEFLMEDDEGRKRIKK